MIEFSDRDKEKMFALERKLSEVLLRVRQEQGGIEAAVAAFACVRCARMLLDRYPEATRIALTEVVEKFLEHATVDESLLLN